MATTLKYVVGSESTEYSLIFMHILLTHVGLILWISSHDTLMPDKSLWGLQYDTPTPKIILFSTYVTCDIFRHFLTFSDTLWWSCDILRLLKIRDLC